MTNHPLWLFVAIAAGISQSLLSETTTSDENKLSDKSKRCLHTIYISPQKFCYIAGITPKNLEQRKQAITTNG